MMKGNYCLKEFEKSPYQRERIIEKNTTDILCKFLEIKIDLLARNRKSVQQAGSAGKVTVIKWAHERTGSLLTEINCNQVSSVH